LQRSATAIVANLPRSIGQREINTVADKLSWPQSSFHVNASIKSAGPGNALLIEIIAEHVHEVFCGFGRIGVSAEKVAHEVVDEVRDYLASGLPVGPYLADQLLLPLGIAAWQSGLGGSFRTVALTRHSTTHIDLLRRFLDIRVQTEQEPSGCRVTVAGRL
jgi:RNA 3'-terminal phosphate cyclase (ATP)